MTLINIEYGSLASSETLNKNFIYLDEKISETTESIQASISSILSNITTINSRLNEISEVNTDTTEALSSRLEDYKSKTKILINNVSMLPDWKKTSTISLKSNYTVPSNGYLLLLPLTTTSGNLTVNGKSFSFKLKSSDYDFGAQLVAIPVLEGDIVSCSAGLLNSFFLPSKEVSLEEF